MPELPEVETVAHGVHARVRGDRIMESWFGSHREPFKNPAGRQARGLRGRVILAVHRTGKHIVCELSAAGAAAGPSAEPAAPRVGPLGVTGRLLVSTPHAPGAPPTPAPLTPARGREPRLFHP